MARTRREALRDECLETQLFWLLTGWFNERGEVPNIFLIERMIDMMIEAHNA